MSKDRMTGFSRRGFMAAAAGGVGAGLALPAFGQQIDPYTGQMQVQQGLGGATPDAGVVQYDAQQDSRRNISSFRMHQDWREFFPSLTNGCILCDFTSRTVTFWGEDGVTWRVYPSSIPVSEDLSRRGRSEIIKKVEGPSWAPTPSMKARNPDWPDFVPPGPDNPLGTHALWLSWQYYRIHGTHDTRKIGRKSSNGCVGLYNEHIKELFGLSKIGTQVLII